MGSHALRRHFDEGAAVQGEGQRRNKMPDSIGARRDFAEA